MTMNEYKVLGTIWFWALMVLIAALHICYRLMRGRKTEIIPIIVNAAAHITLFFLMFMLGADVSELFFALLISLSVALLCKSIPKKSDRIGSGKGE